MADSLVAVGGIGSHLMGAHTGFYLTFSTMAKITMKRFSGKKVKLVMARHLGVQHFLQPIILSG